MQTYLFCHVFKSALQPYRFTIGANRSCSIAFYLLSPTQVAICLARQHLTATLIDMIAEYLTMHGWLVASNWMSFHRVVPTLLNSKSEKSIKEEQYVKSGKKRKKKKRSIYHWWNLKKKKKKRQKKCAVWPGLNEKDCLNALQWKLDYK